MHLEAVRFQRAALRERLLAQGALVRSDTCRTITKRKRSTIVVACCCMLSDVVCVRTGVGAGVPLEVEGVVEALAAEGAQVALDVRVALHVPVEQPLQREHLLADPASELVVLGLRAWQRGTR